MVLLNLSGKTVIFDVSGKTYTILGSDDSPGFIPRSMRHLFAQIRQKFNHAEVDVVLSMSYLEIYQEKVF